MKEREGEDKTLGGLSPKGRRAISALSRVAKSGVIDIGIAAQALDVDRLTAARLLSRLSSRGWLVRARRGTYVLVPIEAERREVVAEDSWVLASSIWSPCYIGGWTAANNWGFTEQIFADVVVITTRAVRKTRVSLLGQRFQLRQIRKHGFFGISRVWRGSIQVEVSDPEKTIVDCLDDPSLAGGVRHLAEILKAYWGSSERNLDRLLQYAGKMRNGAISKRLGYTAEVFLGADERFLNRCRQGMTAGYAVLDPNVKAKGRLLRRWRLWVNVNLQQ